MAGNSIFSDLKEAEDNLTEIENCLCVSCGKTGTTKMLMIEIPFFRQVVVMSFNCDHCDYHNNELQPAQQIAEKGVRYELKVQNIKDLNRQIVKTEWAKVEIPEIEFEIKQQSGLVTTLEGILERAITGLEYSYENSQANEEDKMPLKLFISKLKNLKELREKFTLIIEDISGNSFIENFLNSEPDPQMKITSFIRSNEEDKLLGIFQTNDNENEKNDLKNEVLQFPTNCPRCNAPCFTNMKLTSIPHFKDIIIMATNCDVCGNRTNEVKSGAGIEEKGVRIKVDIKDEQVLKKHVIRSDTCDLFIPQLDLSLQSSGSGRYTTIQGLGLNIIDDLQRTNPFIDGDSTREEIKEKIAMLKKKLENMVGLTIILDDPCGNSWIDNAENDVHIEKYERSFEQNEELGLNQINVEQSQSLE